MRLQLRKPAQSLNRSYARESIPQNQMQRFRQVLGQLIGRVDENGSEQDQQEIIREFLTELFYRPGGPSELLEPRSFAVSIPEQTNLIIHRGSSMDDPAGVAIQVKRVFAGEMMTTLKNNVRALHELILYYFEERERLPQTALSQLAITDVYNWFIFDEADFRRFFYHNVKLRKLYQVKLRQQKDSLFFYTETARILREMDQDVPVTYLNLRDAADALNLAPTDGNRLLIPVWKLFSPEHLLKLPAANDTDRLNHRFYDELLHIIGLGETRQGSRSNPGPILIQRLSDGERHESSLLENTISTLMATKVLTKLEHPDQYGQTEPDQLYAIGLELCITWLSRLLFIKLLEGQLARWHLSAEPGKYPALTAPLLQTFGDLNDLFTEILAMPEASRSAGMVARMGRTSTGQPWPYLNSSLFEPTDLECQTIVVADLDNQLSLPLFAYSILTGIDQIAGSLPTLHYLLAFLDGYDFMTDGPALVQPNNKLPINAAMLGLVFEKLAGHQNESFFTPGFLTTYLVRGVIHRAVLTRFNEQFGWGCPDITTLHDQLASINPDEANAVINSLRLVDPAVGSGHFLVSALHELITLKAELGVLTDRDGQHLRQYDIRVENGELIVTDETGEPFQYVAPLPGAAWRPTEIQRVQETLFHEKQTLIENCLVGVDVNRNSGIISRFRLWAELLKSTYYVGEPGGKKRKKRPDMTLEFLQLHPLPNLDYVIREGNSLVSRLDLTARLAYDTEGLQQRLTACRALMHQYYLETDATARHSIKALMQEIHYYFVRQFSGDDRTLTDKLQRLNADFLLKYATNQLFGDALTARQISDRNKLQADINRLTADIEQTRNNPIFRDAIEWRFVFPQMLDEAGDFAGFDVVLGHLPSGRPEQSPAHKAYFQRAYPNTYASRADQYVFFVELGLNLLRPNGRLACLMPGKWMQAGYGTNLRTYLETVRTEQHTDFDGLSVFDDVVAQPILLAIQKAHFAVQPVMGQ